MRRGNGMLVALLAGALCASGCATAAGGDLGTPQVSHELMKGGQYLEPWLSAALKEAGRHPLGSDENPVRADMPDGERAYLARLRCSNGEPPMYERVGNLGAGVFGSIVDAYDVRCMGAQPAKAMIVMDMYFEGYTEPRAVPGFAIAPP